MTTEDQVVALFAKANPVPSLDLLEPVEVLDMEHLAHLSARSSVMTDVKTDEAKPEGPGRRPRLALAVAMAVIAVVAVGILLNNESEVVSPTTTESTPSTTTASAVGLYNGPLPAGTYRTTPFANDEGICMDASQLGCVDPVGFDSMSFTFTIPNSGWSGGGTTDIRSADNQPPTGAGLLFNLGAWLYSDPCRNDATFPDVPVGLTVEDFANALADHALLEVTTPVDVTLGGYSGKYMDLQVPSDISGCEVYRPWDPWFYAQGPSQRWHLWILDVDGVRVVVQSTDFPGTSPEVQAELEAIVDSIQIQP